MEKQTPFNPFDILNTPWGKLPLGSAIPGIGNFDFTDLKEMDKRISELKAVEQWLALNLNLLKSTIQGLEIQRGTLAAIQSFTESMSAGHQETAGTAEGKSAKASNNPFSIPVSFTDGQVTSPNAQAAAWWDAIQTQFGQMMAATQASAQTMMDPQPKAGKKSAAKKTDGAAGGEPSA